MLAYKGCGTCMDLLNSATKAVCLSLDQCSKGESEIICIRILGNKVFFNIFCVYVKTF